MDVVDLVNVGVMKAMVMLAMVISGKQWLDVYVKLSLFTKITSWIVREGSLSLKSNGVQANCVQTVGLA